MPDKSKPNVCVNCGAEIVALNGSCYFCGIPDASTTEPRKNMTRYSLVAWEFNHVLWASVISTAIKELGVKEFAAIAGVSTSVLHNWGAGRFTDEFKFPHMSNFVKIVNWLDLDPRDFWSLEDTK